MNARFWRPDALFLPALIVLLALTEHHAYAGGTLKICTKPQACTVRVAGYLLEKKGAALTLEHLPAGSYQILCSGPQGRAVRSATVAEGRTTVVFLTLAPSGASSQPQTAQPEPVVGAAAIPPVASSPNPQRPVAASAAYLPPVASSRGGSAASAAAPGKTALGRNYLMDVENAFLLANQARSGLNPLTARNRLTRALTLYRHIIEDFPRTPQTELAHYYCGRIFETSSFRDAEKAIAEYRTVLALNPDSLTDAADRIAMLTAGLESARMQADPATSPGSAPATGEEYTQAPMPADAPAPEPRPSPRLTTGQPKNGEKQGTMTLDRKPDKRPMYMQMLP